MGKLERGTLKYSETYTLIPTKGKVTIDWLLVVFIALGDIDNM